MLSPLVRLLRGSICLLLGTVGTALILCAGSFAQVPLITNSVVPTSVAPGHVSFSLTLNGYGFTSSSTMYWNGSPRKTTYVNTHKLTATILAQDVSKASTAQITVRNPGADMSNTIYFPIVAPFTTVKATDAQYSTGLNPVQVATGDFNNDGKLDAVVIDYADGTVSVLLGHGDGTFQDLSPQKPYPTNNRLVAMAMGDFNGDGKLDLVVITDGGNVGTLLGKGDGTFTALPRFHVSFNPSQIVAGDFNGDGKLDVIVSEGQQGPTNVKVLLGDGKGNFGEMTQNLTYGFNPTWMAAGDFNGDGKLDLAISETLNHSLVILLGAGNGTFPTQSQIALASSNPTQIIAADLNNDGIVDLVVVTGDHVLVFMGKGNGTFTALPGIPIAAGYVAAGDLNGDGKLDLVVLSSRVYAVLLGKGDGTFQPQQQFIGWGNRGLALGDFNNDGKLDFLGGEGGGSAVDIFLQK